MGSLLAGNDTTLKAAVMQVERVAEDATTRMSPVELIEYARQGTSPTIPGVKAIGSGANEDTLAMACDALREVAMTADGLLQSLLCRTLMEKAIELIEKREAEAAAAFTQAAIAVYNLADADGSGQLEYHEVRYIASDQAEAEAILAMLDADSDGQISQSEWVNFFDGLYAMLRAGDPHTVPPALPTALFVLSSPHRGIV